MKYIHWDLDEKYSNKKDILNSAFFPTPDFISKFEVENVGRRFKEVFSQIQE